MKKRRKEQRGNRIKARLGGTLRRGTMARAGGLGPLGGAPAEKLGDGNQKLEEKWQREALKARIGGGETIKDVWNLRTNDQNTARGAQRAVTLKNTQHIE